jgi:DNA-binding response OmpR family regulator
MAGRPVPLIVVASATAALADSVAARLRRAGNVVYVARSADGCLRVAASVGPDVVLLDPALQNVQRYERLIKAHPLCAGTQVLHLTDAVAGPAFTLPRTPAAAAGPHAA